jgi:hypothetical protein
LSYVVNVTHFAGIKHLGPDFDLFPNDTAPASPPKSTISQTDAAVSLTTGGLKVEVDKAAYGFKMDFVGKGTDGKEKVFSSFVHLPRLPRWDLPSQIS